MRKIREIIARHIAAELTGSYGGDFKFPGDVDNEKLIDRARFRADLILKELDPLLTIPA